MDYLLGVEKHLSVFFSEQSLYPLVFFDVAAKDWRSSMKPEEVQSIPKEAAWPKTIIWINLSFVAKTCSFLLVLMGQSQVNISSEPHFGQCTPLILYLWSKVQPSQRKYELLRGEEVEPWSIISMGFWPITNRSRESWLLFQVDAPCLHCKIFEYSFYMYYVLHTEARAKAYEMSIFGLIFLSCEVDYYKSDNLQYKTVVRWFARMKDSSTKHLMFHALLSYNFL